MLAIYNTILISTTIFIALVVVGSYSLHMTRDEVLAKQWWTSEDVRIYLGKKTMSSTRQLMRRAKVKRSKSDRTMTCRVWVDNALSR